MQIFNATPVLAVVLAANLFSATGEAANFGDYTAKGFLSDYSELKPRSGGSDAYLYENPAVDRSRYKRVMIDRIKVFLKEDAKYKGVDPAELKALTDYFHRAIESALAGAYPVVRQPGSDVLRLRIAVTDLVPNKPEASVITFAVPFAGFADAAAGVVDDRPGSTPFVGEATVEMEALDSRTSKQVAAFIETRVGKKYHVDLDDGVGNAVGTGVGDYMKAYSTWAYTKQAMDHWARLIRERLDAARGIGK